MQIPYRSPFSGMIRDSPFFFRTRTIALTFTILILAIGAARAATENYVANGNLTEGTAGTPAGWNPQGWKAGASTFAWEPGAGGGQLRIVNVQPNDAHWIQHMQLGAGWYHFSAQVRTVNVGQSNTGGSLSLLQDWVTSQDLRGTNDWQTLDFYLKVGKGGVAVDLTCRLGGYGALNSGEVGCRAIQAVATAPPSSTTPHVYDLDAINEANAPAPDNHDLSLPMLAAGGLLLVVLIVTRTRRRSGVRSGLVEQAETARARAPAQSEIVTPKPGVLPQAAAAVPAEAPRRRIEIILSAVCMLTFAYFYQASDHNAASRIDLIRSLTERASLWIDYYAGFNTADIVEMGGRIYSNKAPGGAFTGLVPWVIVTNAMRPFVSPGPWFWAVATYLTTLLTIGLISTLLCLVTYRFALLMGARQGRAAALALTLTLATILFPNATQFTGEPIAAFALFTSFYLLARLNTNDGLRPALDAGLLAGWSVVCDYSTFVLAVLVGIYAVWKLRDWRKIGVFALGAGACAMLLAVYDYLAFGHPFFLSYEAYMLPGSDRFEAQKAGFAGVTYPHWTILWDVLFGAQRGLFFCNPVLLLIIPGLYFLWRERARRAEFFVIAAAIIGFILFNGSYGDSIVYWGGGTATGPRHIISALPFMILAMVALPTSFDYLFAILAFVSLWLMLMATAIEPHLPYEYSLPFQDFLWPAYLRGDLAYNKSTFFGGPPIVGDSVAFSLGKLVGLPGALQLFPLLAIWLVAGWQLITEISPGPSLHRRWPAWAGAAALIAMFIPPIAGALFLQPKLNQPYGLLGRYYEGLEPGHFPPHIVRVDPNLDFDDIVALGSLPYPTTVRWSGQLYAPTAGVYQFVISADDDGWLTIDGTPVIRDPGGVTQAQGQGSLKLTPGWHTIQVGHRNLWGDASIHLFWRPPGGAQSLIPSHYLVPASLG